MPAANTPANPSSDHPNVRQAARSSAVGPVTEPPIDGDIAGDGLADGLCGTGITPPPDPVVPFLWSAF